MASEAAMTTSGMAMGRKTRLLTVERARKRYRASAKAAAVPRTVAPTVAHRAIQRLSESEPHRPSTSQGWVQASVEKRCHS
ncbi:hypothetical protein GCM10020221_03560 [Streptomyces thioluteus]|uniref:Uncharacterized protein n=1 Tax=Streptomyces thioluteus TaxID=66431 RepID=A0ABN3WD75_STRTU